MRLSQWFKLCLISRAQTDWSLDVLCGICGVSVSDLERFSLMLTSMGGVCRLDVGANVFTFPYPLVGIDKGYLQQQHPEKSIYFYQCVNSTNTLCFRLPYSERIQVVLAEYQFAGRGQYQRRWRSAYAGDILLSLKISVEGCVDWSRLSVFLGRQLCRFFAQILPDRYFYTKYPNDVYCARRKCAGILVEGESLGKQMTLIVGVGVNVHSLLSEGVSLGVLGGKFFDRSVLAGALIDVLEQSVTAYQERFLK